MKIETLEYNDPRVNKENIPEGSLIIYASGEDGEVLVFAKDTPANFADMLEGIARATRKRWVDSKRSAIMVIATEKPSE